MIVVAYHTSDTNSQSLATHDSYNIVSSEQQLTMPESPYRTNPSAVVQTTRNETADFTLVENRQRQIDGSDAQFTGSESIGPNSMHLFASAYDLKDNSKSQATAPEGSGLDKNHELLSGSLITDELRAKFLLAAFEAPSSAVSTDRHRGSKNGPKEDLETESALLAELPANQKKVLAPAFKHLNTPAWARSKQASVTVNGRFGCAASESVILCESGTCIDAATVFSAIRQLQDRGYQIKPYHERQPGDVMVGHESGSRWKSG